MEKLLLVDGSNLLFQMFYGMPARILNAQGKPIQGTLGFVGALLKIIRRVQPTYVAVLFDGECHNERRDIDENYKANREDFSQMAEEDTPFCQMPDVYRALDHMGIRHAETTVCETDDWMAAYCHRYGQDTQIIIASQDSDFFSADYGKCAGVALSGGSFGCVGCCVHTRKVVHRSRSICGF